MLRAGVALWAMCLAGTAAATQLPLVEAAKKQIGVTMLYDPAYQQLRSPNGDVPIERGVCTDVVIRAYRHLGMDLQKLVHEDMRSAWKLYPRTWSLRAPDKNIDHRRVPNLQVFFTRHGKVVPVSQDPASYQPGDIVTWSVPPALPHIGIVADQRNAAGTPLIIHNIGSGTRMEDRLFAYTITGHYRYPAKAP